MGLSNRREAVVRVILTFGLWCAVAPAYGEWERDESTRYWVAETKISSMVALKDGGDRGSSDSGLVGLVLALEPPGECPEKPLRFSWYGRGPARAPSLLIDMAFFAFAHSRRVVVELSDSDLDMNAVASGSNRSGTYCYVAGLAVLAEEPFVFPVPSYREFSSGQPAH